MYKVLLSTKLMRPVVACLRNKGHLLVIYLDNMLCINDTHKGYHQQVSEIISLLESLGFVINYNKSDLTPSQVKTFLGCEIDSIDMALKLPTKKRLKILDRIDSMSVRRKLPIREFAQFLGLLTSVCPAVSYRWVYTKSLERAKFLALQ